MQTKSIIALIIIGLIAFVTSNSLYIVKETEVGIKLRFGEIVETDIKSGLHLKIPFLNTIRYFDIRLQTLDSKPSRYLTLEKKIVIVDSFVQWRIIDVKKYYEATSGNLQIASNLIAPRIDESLRNQFGKRDLVDIISEKRDDLMSNSLAILSEALKNSLGIELLDIRIKKIDLPDNVSSSVYERMRTERQKEAREYRAQGQESAEKIKARADKEKVLILANANKEAQKIRGEGDAKVADIYARSYGIDRDFFKFWRTMQTYEESLKNKQDVLILSPDSEFLRYLEKSRP